MATGQFNIAKGRFNELARRVELGDPATCGLLISLYKTVEAEATLKTRTTKALVDANNALCDFTNFSEQFLVNVQMALVADQVQCFSDNVTWAFAGTSGVGVNNTVDTAVIYYVEDIGNIATYNVPLGYYTVGVTTTGINLVIDVPPSGLYIDG